ESLHWFCGWLFFFFFQAEDGIRDDLVTGVQTCALPISFADDAGAIVCEADSWCFRTERDTARELKKYGKVEPYRYSPDEIERIRRAYAAEEIRGVTPRYWEDVKVGEPLPAVVKGPLTVTSLIAFIQGWGSLYVRAHGLAFDLFERHPALGIPNEFGVPEPPERVHW